MKEELTTKMHAEFKVSRAIDVRHRCFTVLSLINKDTTEALKLQLYAMYDVDAEDVDDAREWLEAQKKS
jgi:hypothetical protein